MIDERLYAELRVLAGSGKKVRLTRGRPHEPFKHGFLVAASPALTLIEQFHDFHPDGFAVVLTGDITEVRSGDHERHWERMFRAEGIPATGDLGNRLPLGDLPALLAELATWDENAIVECEDAQEHIEDFYIGRILWVRGGTAAFSSFDALGRWNAEPVEIPVADITQVQLRTPYCEIFSKYVEGPCPHA